MFYEIPEWLNSIRTVPKGGGWVFIRGWAPSIPLPGFCDDLKIKRMDIYWAFNELLVTNPENFFKSRRWNIWLDEKGMFQKGDSVQEDDIENAVKSFKDYAAIINNPLCPDYSGRQLTIMQVSHWSPQVIRFHNGEVSYFSDEKLNECLDVEAYIPIKFGEEEESNVILKETQQSIVDALMLDGLNYSQALKNVIDAGIIKNVQYPVPPYYYKLRDEYAEYFSTLRSGK